MAALSPPTPEDLRHLGASHGHLVRAALERLLSRACKQIDADFILANDTRDIFRLQGARAYIRELQDILVKFDKDPFQPE